MKSRDRSKLRERARRLAERPDSGQDRELALEVAVVLIGDESIGIPVDHLREIVRLPPLTALPSLPPHFRGLVQIRGELVSVIDLGQLIGLPSTREGGLLAIVERDGRSLGLAIDGLAEFREIYRDEIAKDFDQGSRLSSGLARATTRDLLTILDLKKLLNDDRIVVRDSRSLASQEAAGTSVARDRSPSNPSQEGGTHDVD